MENFLLKRKWDDGYHYKYRKSGEAIYTVHTAKMIDGVLDESAGLFEGNILECEAWIRLYKQGIFIA